MSHFACARFQGPAPFICLEKVWKSHYTPILGDVPTKPLPMGGGGQMPKKKFVYPKQSPISCLVTAPTPARKWPRPIGLSTALACYNEVCALCGHSHSTEAQQRPISCKKWRPAFLALWERSWGEWHKLAHDWLATATPEDMKRVSRLRIPMMPCPRRLNHNYVAGWRGRVATEASAATTQTKTLLAYNQRRPRRQGTSDSGRTILHEDKNHGPPATRCSHRDPLPTCTHGLPRGTIPCPACRCPHAASTT